MICRERPERGAGLGQGDFERAGMFGMGWAPGKGAALGDAERGKSTKAGFGSFQGRNQHDHLLFALKPRLWVLNCLHVIVIGWFALILYFS